MSMYGKKTLQNYKVVSLQLIKINEKKFNIKYKPISRFKKERKKRKKKKKATEQLSCLGGGQVPQ